VYRNMCIDSRSVLYNVYVYVVVYTLLLKMSTSSLHFRFTAFLCCVVNHL